MPQKTYGICNRTERPDQSEKQSGIQPDKAADHLHRDCRRYRVSVLLSDKGKPWNQQCGTWHGAADGSGISLRHV